jgi:hypothetical protein
MDITLVRKKVDIKTEIIEYELQLVKPNLNLTLDCTSIYVDFSDPRCFDHFQIKNVKINFNTQRKFELEIFGKG